VALAAPIRYIMPNPLLTLVRAAFKPISDILIAREKRKQAATTVRAKAQMARDANELQQTLTDAEWEVVSRQAQGNGWRDEYATIVGTLPYPTLFLGCMWYAFTGDYRMVEGAIAAIHALTASGVDVGFLLEAMLLAAVGLSIWRKLP
jgi:hypothetical protein